MALSIKNIRLSGVKNIRSLATKSAAKTDDLHRQGKPQVKQQKLPNGLTIIAIENHSPISRVGVFVRAGARLEQPGQLGITHALRVAAGLSTTRSTTFGITRNIDYLGGSLTTSSTREDLIYVAECNRDNTSACVGFLADVVTKPAFKPWELSDDAFRLKLDRKRMKLQPEVRLMELTHAAAFKNGLCNSLFSPKHMVGKHDHNMLMEYVVKHFVTNRMAVVGLGVELPLLVESVEKNFAFNSGPASDLVKPKFVPGNLRKEGGGNVAYVSVVAEGAGAKNAKEALSLSLFQQILGSGPRVKYSEAKNTPLGSAAGQATQHPFALTGINVNYSDTGLFGFVAGAAADDIGNVVKSVVKKMRDVGKAVNDTQLKTAK